MSKFRAQIVIDIEGDDRELVAYYLGDIHEKVPEWGPAQHSVTIRAKRSPVVQNDAPPDQSMRSLLRPASTKAASRCCCTERCAAPRIMGRQMPCLDPEKSARFVENSDRLLTD